MTTTEGVAPLQTWTFDLSEAGVPPSSNHIYVNSGFGGRTKSTEAKAYQNRVTAVLGRVLQQGSPPDPNLPYGVHIRIDSNLLNAGFPKRAKSRFRKFDVSNLRKLLEDAIATVFGVDDSATIDAFTSKRHTDGPDRVLVSIYQYPVHAAQRQ